MKYVYIVTGSEDGVIAVCGARRTAVEKALWYIDQDNQAPEDTVKRLITVLGHCWAHSVYGDYATATIEKMPLE